MKKKQKKTAVPRQRGHNELLTGVEAGKNVYPPVQIHLPFETARLNAISHLAESNLLLAQALNVSVQVSVTGSTFVSDGKVPAMQIGK